MNYENKQEIPFGAFDSELMRQEISIPDGFEAVIEGNKIILKKIESEDERIRNLIINHLTQERGSLSNDEAVEAIDWLEKQGESNPYSGTSFEYNGHTWGMCARDNGVEIGFDGELKAFLSSEKSFIYPIHLQPDLTSKSALEAAKEEKIDNQNCVQPADKTEPKFKVGDWVVRGKTIAQILDIQEQYYVGLDIDGNDFTSSRFLSDDKIHLWTIQDAKDGDVLASKDKEDILIYKSYSVIDLLLTSHISFSKKEGFCPRQYSAWDSNEFIPATKEQRDLLFKKMHEAGYMWDSDSKRLLSLKAEPSGEQRSVWSEEDEERLNSCLNIIQAKGMMGVTDTINTKWLKSLKERYTWKPSDEQMEALLNTLHPDDPYYVDLSSLYNDLKKLTE